jgi:hypothetical protein
MWHLKVWNADNRIGDESCCPVLHGSTPRSLGLERHARLILLRQGKKQACRTEHVVSSSELLPKDLC